MVPRSLIAILAVSTLVGCASNRPFKPNDNRVSLEHLNQVMLDCRNKNLQTGWLKNQLAIGANADVSNPQAQEYERDFNSRARTLLWQLRTVCP